MPLRGRREGALRSDRSMPRISFSITIISGRCWNGPRVQGHFESGLPAAVNFASSAAFRILACAGLT
jgi:hypothetical protein